MPPPLDSTLPPPPTLAPQEHVDAGTAGLTGRELPVRNPVDRLPKAPVAPPAPVDRYDFTGTPRTASPAQQRTAIGLDRQGADTLAGRVDAATRATGRLPADPDTSWHLPAGVTPRATGPAGFGLPDPGYTRNADRSGITDRFVNPANDPTRGGGVHAMQPLDTGSSDPAQRALSYARRERANRVPFGTMGHADQQAWANQQHQDAVAHAYTLQGEQRTQALAIANQRHEENVAKLDYQGYRDYLVAQGHSNTDAARIAEAAIRGDAALGGAWLRVQAQERGQDVTADTRMYDTETRAGTAAAREASREKDPVAAAQKNILDIAGKLAAMSGDPTLTELYKNAVLEYDAAKNGRAAPDSRPAQIGGPNAALPPPVATPAPAGSAPRAPEQPLAAPLPSYLLPPGMPQPIAPPIAAPGAGARPALPTRTDAGTMPTTGADTTYQPGRVPSYAEWKATQQQGAPAQQSAAPTTSRDDAGLMDIAARISALPPETRARLLAQNRADDASHLLPPPSADDRARLDAQAMHTRARLAGVPVPPAPPPPDMAWIDNMVNRKQPVSNASMLPQPQAAPPSATLPPSPAAVPAAPQSFNLTKDDLQPANVGDHTVFADGLTQLARTKRLPGGPEGVHMRQLIAKAIDGARRGKVLVATVKLLQHLQSLPDEDMGDMGISLGPDTTTAYAQPWQR